MQERGRFPPIRSYPCTPWQFLSYFPDPGLRDAVRNGRRAEFGEHGWGELEHA